VHLTTYHGPYCNAYWYVYTMIINIPVILSSQKTKKKRRNSEKWNERRKYHSLYCHGNWKLGSIWVKLWSNLNSKLFFCFDSIFINVTYSSQTQQLRMFKIILLTRSRFRSVMISRYTQRIHIHDWLPWQLHKLLTCIPTREWKEVLTDADVTRIVWNGTTDRKFNIYCKMFIEEYHNFYESQGINLLLKIG
jgi:hypothetical protein